MNLRKLPKWHRLQVAVLWGAALTTAALLAPPVRAQDAAATRQAPFAAGGLVVLDVNVANLRVVPAEQENTLRLVVTPHRAQDAAYARDAIREFSANGSQAKIVVHVPDHSDNDGSIDLALYVPKQSHLQLHVKVGNVEIRGVRGNADVDVGVGNLDFAVPDPHLYRSVSLSVRIGDVDAKAFGLEPSGFLGKSVEKEFSGGQYRLKLHAGVGNIDCNGGGD